ncbi:hypothetical protein [Pseudonocardia nigra]|uniref:hypothetical protein n=1 Tax=Pseudonocardia nigra TaxID=1921578 RepID=UPI001C5D3426|nr:hypothetical protein [Pseudonocardia nigra]
MTIDVHQAAREFGQELQDLLDAVLPKRWSVDQADRQIVVLAGSNSRYVVRVAQRHGLIELLRNGHHVAYLRVEYHCTADTAQNYLAVQKSDFELRSAADRVPLARLDYVWNAHTVPAAHWNVHAERGAVSHLLGRTNPDHPGLVSKLHFTVGGSRMRPCLEDFIALFVYEFKFDLRPGAQAILEEGRERWRRRQIGALVRDAPDEAVRVLGELGYTILPPASGHAPANTASLRRA